MILAGQQKSEMRISGCGCTDPAGRLLIGLSTIAFGKGVLCRSRFGAGVFTPASWRRLYALVPAKTGFRLP